MGVFKNMQNAAFDNFDPTLNNNFDPSLARAGRSNSATGDDPATSLVRAKAGQKMQINITFTNNAAVNLTFELFCYIDSFINRLKTEYVTGNYLYVPLLSLEGLTRHAGTHGGIVGFDQNGTLVIEGDEAAADGRGTIGCGEISYNGLFQASGITPFTVSFIRYTVNTTQQIDQQITYFTKSYSGGTTENKINPRAYFKPNQFQDLTLDITVMLGVDIQSGLRQVVLPGEFVRLSFFITIWSDQVQ